jgi:hypothetical protein
MDHLFKWGGGVIDGLMDADRFEKFMMAGRGGADDVGSDPLGELDRIMADTSGRRMDQDLLPRFKMGKIDCQAVRPAKGTAAAWMKSSDVGFSATSEALTAMYSA